MKVRFEWETIVSRNFEEYELKDLSRKCIENLVLFCFKQISGTNKVENLAFNLNDYFISQMKAGKRKSTDVITKEDLEEVLNIITTKQEQNFVSPVFLVPDPKHSRYLH